MKHLYITAKRGFTLLEVVMVIVILGIVASISSSVIADVFEHYIIQRATQRASIKTELAAQQIANMLSYRIRNTTLARQPSNLSNFVLVSDATNISDNVRTVLEWIGYDHDSFMSATATNDYRPGWNGFCDINASLTAALPNDIVTPGSNLALASTIMRNLTQNDIPNSDNPAIFFNDNVYQAASTSGGLPVNDIVYNVNCMGLTNAADTTCISSVGFNTATQLTFDPTAAARPNKRIVEHYKLAVSAYAIWPEPNPRTGNFDLRLYYNYQPWSGETLAKSNNFRTLLTNVTVFKFAESANTFRFKLCAQEQVGNDFNITICKEKAIIL